MRNLTTRLSLLTFTVRHVLPIIVGVALSFGVVAAQAAKGANGTTPDSASNTNTKVRPALDTCGAGQRCTGMPYNKPSFVIFG
jgi:hypothetical protein